MKFYILKDRKPVAVDMITWARWFESPDRIVAQSQVNGVSISTVCLGTDHNFWMWGPPILFETMIFDGFMDQYQERCATWAQAERMHCRALSEVLQWCGISARIQNALTTMVKEWKYNYRLIQGTVS